MKFNQHRHLEGKHAFLAASKYSWLNYDEEKLRARYVTASAAQRGTELHAFAAEAIRLNINLPRTSATLNTYVNDAIGFRMIPEVILYYSDNAFGTADALSFRRNKLRIHDLKTGVTVASEKQLFIYAAFFCLEYGVKPHTITMDLRLYQNDEVQSFSPDPDEIVHYMDTIKHFDSIINQLREENEQ